MKKKELIPYIILIVCVFVLVLLRILGYENCLYKVILKIPCPGCGMTRAYLSLLRLDINQAFKYHPLFWLVPIVILLFIFRNKKSLSFLYKKNIIWVIILLTYIITYIIRLVNHSIL